MAAAQTAAGWAVEVGGARRLGGSSDDGTLVAVVRAIAVKASEGREQWQRLGRLHLGQRWCERRR
jgi:hypothetical protein